MLRVECDCGRVMYEGINRCPNCGRSLVGKPKSSKEVNNRFSMVNDLIRSIDKDQRKLK